MKKRKLIPLSMMLLCSVCFSSACSNSSTTNTNVIATVNGNKITAEGVYNGLLYNESTAKYVYDVLERALIQSAIPETNSMRTKVQNEVEKWRREIEDNATLNGTNYKEDLQLALENEGASSIEEYTNNKIYTLQKQYAKEKFLEANKEAYTKGYIDANYLYHVKDIQLTISTSSNKTDLYNLSMTEEEAERLYQALNELVTGEPFYNIANYYSSGDAKKNGGDLGVVSLNDTDITNELRYALVGYSSIIEGKYSSFNFPTTEDTMTLTDLYNSGMQTIPYSYIKKLNDIDENDPNDPDREYFASTNKYYYADGSTSSSNLSSKRFYYRNIVFNNLLNTKTPKFITVTQEDVDAGARAVKMSVLTPSIDTVGYNSTKSEEYVLVNEKGNPYVVFKDSNGLHVMSVEKTPFASDLYEYYSYEAVEDETYTYIELGSNTEERINEVNSFSEKYVSRDYGSSESNSELLSFAMFKYYLNSPNNGGFEIVDENVKKMIEQYINSQTELADKTVTSDFEGYYKEYANIVWLRTQDFITKEIPLLACLEKNDGKWSCTYKYGEGFKKYEGGTN